MLLMWRKMMIIDTKDLIFLIKERHSRQSSFETGEWTNQHGLDRCDCEELIEWVDALN